MRYTVTYERELYYRKNEKSRKVLFICFFLDKIERKLVNSFKLLTFIYSKN